MYHTMKSRGDFIIPENRLPVLVSLAATLSKELGDQEFNSERIRTTLDYKKKTTDFYNKLADLKLYGFLEGKGQKIRISELTKQALGDDEDRQEALEEIFQRIKLWKILQRDYAVEDIETDNFAGILSTLTGTPVSIEDAEFIKDAYLNDLRSVKRFSKSSKSHKETLTTGEGELAINARTGGPLDSEAIVMRFEPLEGGQMLVEIKGIFSQKVARKIQQVLIIGTNNNDE